MLLQPHQISGTYEPVTTLFLRSVVFVKPIYALGAGSAVRLYQGQKKGGALCILPLSFFSSFFPLFHTQPSSDSSHPQRKGFRGLETRL